MAKIRSNVAHGNVNEKNYNLAYKELNISKRVADITLKWHLVDLFPNFDWNIFNPIQPQKDKIILW